MRRARALPMLALAWLGTASAQGPAEAPVCHGSSPAVSEARSDFNRDQSLLAARIKLADALVDQNCYDDAVKLLEAGQAIHPQSPTLEARLRSTRSMISEQNYITNVTRAEDAARLQRNLLRCHKLADVAACDEALSARRNDPELLAARQAAIVQKGHAAEPVTAAAAPSTLRAPASRVMRPAVVAAATPRSKPVVYSNEAPASRSN